MTDTKIIFAKIFKLKHQNDDNILILDFLPMFEALVERILNKILGEYVEDFSAENLKIGLWSG